GQLRRSLQERAIAFARRWSRGCLEQSFRGQRPADPERLAAAQGFKEPARLECLRADVVDDAETGRDAVEDIEADEIAWRDVARFATAPAQTAQTQAKATPDDRSQRRPRCRRQADADLGQHGGRGGEPALDMAAVQEVVGRPPAPLQP